MKKLIIPIFVLATAWTTAQAQSFNLGLKAGVNLAKLDADYASSENRLGYQVGVWARVGAASFYVQPEVYAGSKGSKFINFTQNGNQVNANGTVKFTTLTIPVLLGTKFGTKNYNIRVMAGPAVSFVLDDQSTFDSAYQQAKNFNDYKSQTFAVQGGAGLDVGKLSVDLRYEAGLNNISKSETYSQKENVFQLSLGFKIL